MAITPHTGQARHGARFTDRLTKSAARNIFYGGSLFFLVVFAALVAHSHYHIRTVSTDESKLTSSVEAGNRIWERHSCINCHTLLGEGAYFAPELGNVWVRYGGREDADSAREALKAWMISLSCPGEVCSE